MEQKEFVIEKLRTYSYKQIPAKPVHKKSPEQLCYLYIGKNFEHISKMITGFESSFNFDNFISALKGINDSQSLPDVILFDGAYPPRETNYFLEVLHKEYNSENILTIAEASGCSRQQINLLKHSKLIDDLISLDIPDETLKFKVKYLKRIKSVQDPALLNEKLQTGFKRENVFDSFSKRLFEIILSLVLLTLLSPILLLIALAIKMESKGPVFYISPRAGRGYKIFKFYKFRTMVMDADKKKEDISHLNQYTSTDTGPVFFKANNDPRITKVGAFLRNTSLDELLQLYNVVLGNMSLVGNRPLPLDEAATLTTDEHAARFMAPAGITGLWQIKKRGNENMSVQERINLDIDYSEKSCFVYDLWIMANTPKALLQKTNV